MTAALHHYFERCLVIGWMTQIDPLLSFELSPATSDAKRLLPVAGMPSLHGCSHMAVWPLFSAQQSASLEQLMLAHGYAQN